MDTDEGYQTYQRYTIIGVPVEAGMWRVTAYDDEWMPLCTYSGITWSIASVMCKQHIDAATTAEWLGLESPVEGEAEGLGY